MLEAIHTRLTAMLPADRWRAIEIAEDIDHLSARAGQINTPAVIVMPWREGAEPQSLASGGFRQRIETQFATGIVLRHYDQLMGAARATRFDSLKAELEAVLAGWVLPNFVSPCELVGGESSPITTGVSIYVETWATARFLTGETP